MSRSVMDYDFDYAFKPCAAEAERENPYTKNPTGNCIGEICPFFECCDLSQKEPPTAPTAPKKGIMSC